MRLFLSSYRAGNYPKRLEELFGKGIKVAVITNAKDYKPPQERKEKVGELLDFFTGLGMKPKEIDLRDYFSDTEKLAKDFSGYPALWLAGGNTFLLRKALRQSNLEALLGDAVRKNEIVLGGESAGAIIMGPTLKGSENVDDPEDNPYFTADGYDNKVIWEGLDFINFVPVPHYQSGDYGSSIDNFVEYLTRQSIPHRTMTDTQAIIINGAKEEFLR